MKTISRNEIRELIASGGKFTLVEALPESFYEKGHLPGAICLPSGHIATLAPQALPDKKQTVIVYCSGLSCQNSLIACEELQQLGYTDVQRYVEGKADWQEADLAIETSCGDEDEDHAQALAT